MLVLLHSRRSRRCVVLLRPGHPPSAKRFRPGQRRKRDRNLKRTRNLKHNRMHNRKRHARLRAASVAVASTGTTEIPEDTARAATASATPHVIQEVREEPGQRRPGGPRQESGSMKRSRSLAKRSRCHWCGE